VNYLSEKQRLLDFINLKTFFPNRVEFHDYLAWCANAVSNQVVYGREVVRIETTEARSRGGSLLRVVTRNADGSGPETAVVTSALLLAQGLAPRIPLGIQPGPRIWHSAELLYRLSSIPSDVKARFVVVGSGQSAAEAVAHIHRRFTAAQVHAVCSRYGYLPADDSPFVNRLFDPEAVDVFHSRPAAVRKRILLDHANTNYSVVDLDLITSLYQAWYQEKVVNCPRLHLENRTQLVDVMQNADDLRLTLAETGEGRALRSLGADYLVCATGYDPVPVDMLMTPSLREMIRRDENGAAVIARDYRVETVPGLGAKIIVQGACESSHGLSASLISNLAVRAGEILEAVLDGPQERLGARPSILADRELTPAAANASGLDRRDWSNDASMIPGRAV
jgi:L-ornithine N5-monooxygenase